MEGREPGRPTPPPPAIDGAGGQRPAESAPLDFRLLFEESPDVLLVLLPDAPRYTMVAASHARWRATHTTSETLRRGLFEVFPDNPDDPAATGSSNLRASLERVLQTRRPDTMPVQRYDIRGPDGQFESRYWSPKNLPILAPSGEVLYILHRVEDVTDLVRASELSDELRGRTRAMEREVVQRSHELAEAVGGLREANARLAGLDRAKTEFFSNVSHEFRTPLTLMLGPLEDELADRQALPPQRRQRLETAHRNAMRLLRLVNTLLDFAKIEADRTQASFEPVDLGALTRDLVSAFHAAADRAGLQLTVDCPRLPEPLYVDTGLYEKIVFNLLSNALKHTFAGSIRVALCWCGDHAKLSVSDTGIGIAASELPRVFERFHRVQGAPSRSHEGTGIGLALVRELTAMHGGVARVASQPGQGSTFALTIKAGTAHLPADRILAAASTPSDRRTAYIEDAVHWLTSAEDAAEDRVETDDQPGSQGLPRILWADDNPDMRRYVRGLLAGSYDVQAVADGELALEAARSAPPDLILADVMMPRLDGFGLLKALRADERTRRLPVILLSARAGEEAAIGGLDAGADDYLTKPFSSRELLARVRAHVQLGRQRKAFENELEARVRERTGELVATVDALAAENARRETTERTLQAQLQRLSLLDHITRAIAARQDLRSIFEVVIGNVEQNLPAHACWIGLDAATEGRPTVREFRYEPDLSQGVLWIPDALSGRALRSAVAAPLHAEGQMLGVLIAGRREVNGFNEGEREFLRQLSEHVALAAHAAQMRESLQGAYAELHETQRRMLQQERLSALGQMASGIGHDINNAISPIVIYVDQLLERESTLSTAARAQLEIIQRSIEDVSQTVARMREFYRSRDPQHVLLPVDLNALVLQAVDRTRARWSDMSQRRGIDIQLHTVLAPGLAAVAGVDSELRDALTNLIFNAVDALPNGGAIQLRTYVTDVTHPGAPGAAVSRRVHLEVSDNGLGMDEATRRRCVEPFFTTKGERGTGLGLAMVYGTMQRHRADIDIQSSVGQGTTIRLTFPAHLARAPAIAVGQNADCTGPLHILIVDDDPLVRMSLRDALSVEGHEVIPAEGGQAGIDAFRAAYTSHRRFDVVITDLGMPLVDGRHVAAAVKGLARETPVILLTGWGQAVAAEEVLSSVDVLLAKPPKLSQLREALARCAAVQSPRSSRPGV